jgi:hypothetical protein
MTKLGSRPAAFGQGATLHGRLAEERPEDTRSSRHRLHPSLANVCRISGRRKTSPGPVEHVHATREQAPPGPGVRRVQSVFVRIRTQYAENIACGFCRSASFAEQATRRASSADRGFVHDTRNHTRFGRADLVRRTHIQRSVYPSGVRGDALDRAFRFPGIGARPSTAAAAEVESRRHNPSIPSLAARPVCDEIGTALIEINASPAKAE